jgi:glutamine amidotransferase
MAQPIAIVDYGMGNLHSVANAIRAVGGDPVLVKDPEQLAQFPQLILPGVGAFGDAANLLASSGLGQALTEQVAAGKPVMGICLGMQLMCKSSEEGGTHQGLGWFDAHVRLFPASLKVKVPHIGWNNLEFTREHGVLTDLSGSPDVYFVHSYRVECANTADVLAWCDYGAPFAAMIAHENVCGLQFHPEKSQRVGLAMLKNFVEGRVC